MWIITRDGFFSVVQYDADRWPSQELPVRLNGIHEEDVLVVRTRAVEDVKALVDFLAQVVGDLLRKPGEEHIIPTPSADYEFRVFVTRSEWEAYLTTAVEELDYTNFKGSIEDDARHDIYMSVWGVLQRISAVRKGRFSSWEQPSMAFEDTHVGEQMRRSKIVPPIPPSG